MLEYYHRKGYSENWINQRLKSIEVRKELTDEWERRGIKKGQEFATLTDIITLGWSGMTTRQYKQFKGLKTESLRDNMTNLELVLNMLAEATTTEISKERKPRTIAANRIVAAQGGRIAGNTRREIEAQTGKKIVSRLNAKQALAAKESERIEGKKDWRRKVCRERFNDKPGIGAVYNSDARLVLSAVQFAKANIPPGFRIFREKKNGW